MHTHTHTNTRTQTHTHTHTHTNTHLLIFLKRKKPETTVAFVYTTTVQPLVATELYRINKGRYRFPRFLGTEAENQQCLVTLDTPSSGKQMAILQYSLLAYFANLTIRWQKQ